MGHGYHGLLPGPKVPVARVQRPGLPRCPLRLLPSCDSRTWTRASTSLAARSRSAARCCPRLQRALPHIFSRAPLIPCTTLRSPALTRLIQAHLEDIDADAFAAQLQLGGLPDPDLLIRTGGEQRISNFLLWNLAYAELYFCDTLWPDFGDAEFEAALAYYAQRQRRYGHTGEQIEAAS